MNQDSEFQVIEALLERQRKLQHVNGSRERELARLTYERDKGSPHFIVERTERRR